MSWEQLLDSDNPENDNAGNGGDLAKHSVYAGTLRYLLARDPWSTELGCENATLAVACTR